MLLGICLVFSVDFVFDKVLKDYQRGRIEVLLGMKEDPMGDGYNVPIDDCHWIEGSSVKVSCEARRLV